MARIKVKIRERILLSLVFLIGYGCIDSSVEKTVSQQVYDDLIYDLLDTLVATHELKGSKIIHYEIYPDKLKKEIIASTVQELKSDTTLKADLIRGLMSIIQDSVVLLLEKKIGRDYQFIFESKDVIESITKDDPSHVTLNLSPVFVSEYDKIGCFYAAINCGKKCSAGYYIFVKKSKDNWTIRAMIRNWYSQNFKEMS